MVTMINMMTMMSQYMGAAIYPARMWDMAKQTKMAAAAGDFHSRIFPSISCTFQRIAIKQGPDERQRTVFELCI